jgi:L-ascorbate metabolism protein UlaG (beta-lactamase superfamily)
MPVCNLLPSTSPLPLASRGGSVHYSLVKAHHTGQGFRNIHPHLPKQSFWKWRWERLRHGIPGDPEEGYAFPQLKPDATLLAQNRTEPMLTWLGHATFLLQLGGVNLLTDPHLTDRASPLSFVGFRRYFAPPLSFEELPHIDIVLVSHSHYDHLDLDTLKRLAMQKGGAPRYFFGLGLKRWAEGHGIPHVAELDWGDRVKQKGLSLHFVPVQHWSARTPWDTNRTLWGAWVIEHAGRRYFFGGDFGYSKDLSDAAGRFAGFDLAMIPIGSYEPRWFMKDMHVNPEEAVQAHIDLRARFSIGMHWGTFRLTDERLDEPPARLAKALAKAGVPGERFFVMKHGETLKLEELFALSADEDRKRNAAGH